MYKEMVCAVIFAILFIATRVWATTPAEQAFLAQHGLQGKTVVEMIDHIDQSTQERPLPYTASVTSTELKLSDGKEVFTYALEDQFYLSIAPYVTYTHDCFNHSLSGCRAELVNTTYRVTAKDKADNIIFDEDVTSFSNGFYGLWLPRNTSGTVEVTYNGLKGLSSFSTGEENQTCMTTIQLQ